MKKILTLALLLSLLTACGMRVDAGGPSAPPSSGHAAPPKAGSLSNLFTITSPATNQVLQYNGSTWINAAATAAILSPGTAGQLLVTNAGATAGAWASCSQDIACSTSTVGQMALQSITPTGGTSTVVPFNAGGFKLATTPWVLQDSGAVQRFSLETAHGRGTFGGGGTDALAILGPYTANNAAAATLHLLPNGTAASAANYAVYGDGTNLVFNTVGGSGNFQWYNNNFTLLGTLVQSSLYLGGNSGAAPLQLTWSTSTSPILQSGTSATSLTVGTNKAGAAFNIFDDANLQALQFSVTGGANKIALYDQNGAASGAFISVTSGGTETIAGPTGGSIYFQGTPGAVPFINMNGSNMVQASNNIIWEDTGGTTTGTWTLAHSGATQFQVNANVTSFNINWVAASGAAGTTGLAGQGAGGTNDGGPVQLIGGNHSGAAKADGSVKIVNAPFNGAFLSFTPANGSQTLNNAQSDDNFVLLNAGATNPVTINWLREIADTSCVWIKNNTSQTVTVAYLSGGTVTIATATSALVCSDGANLQKIMTGTWLDPLDTEQWSPLPANDNAKHKEAA